DDLANLTHKLENIFDGIRYDRISVQTEMMDYLFHAVDHLNEMVEEIAQGGDGKRNIADVMRQLDKIEKGEQNFTEQQAPSEETTDDFSPELTLDEFQITILSESKERGFDNYEIY